MEELIVVMLKAMWGMVQIIYVAIRFIFQTIFFLRSKIPESPEVYDLQEQTRFEHTLIVGGSGHGKTQLLQHIFMTFDLRDVMAGRKSVIFIDSQGDMLQKILHLAELRPSRLQEVRQEPPKPARLPSRQEVKQAARQAQQKNSPRVQQTPTTLLRHIWHGCLVFLLLVALLFIGAGAATATKSEALGIVLIIPLGFLAGAWLKRRKHPPLLLTVSLGAAVFAVCLATLVQITATFVFIVLEIVGVTLLGFVLIRPRAGEVSAPAEVVAVTDVPEASAMPGQPIEEVVAEKSEEAPPVTWEKPEAFADRLILIDPNDVENPPCLNLFDFGLDRIKDYSAVDREKFINSAIALYEYMFGALLGAELSQRQGVIFRYLARLLMVVPNPTIYTLMDFMEEPERVREYLPRLDVQTQRFFVTQFFSHKFDDTRQQILTRLWGVLSNNVLARMFSHTHNKLNLFEAMNRGSLILINTAKDLLKQEGCEIFGRFMITCISQATQERAALPESKRLPTFIYIDEASDYFDDSLEELLNTARKYCVGLIIATQNLGQFSHKLLASVLSSTSIKFAGGVSRHDAVALAGEMKTDPEFILSTQKGGGQTQFVSYVRNAMAEAVGFTVPLGVLERSPKMGSEDFTELLQQNRAKYTAAYEPALLEGSAALAQSGISFALDEPQRPI